PDAGERGGEGEEPGRVRHDAQAVACQRRPDGRRVDLGGVGGGRLQGEVHEVEAVPADPLYLLQPVACRVVHRTDLPPRALLPSWRRAVAPVTALSAWTAARRAGIAPPET